MSARFRCHDRDGSIPQHRKQRDVIPRTSPKRTVWSEHKQNRTMSGFAGGSSRENLLSVGESLMGGKKFATEQFQESKTFKP